LASFFFGDTKSQSNDAELGGRTRVGALSRADTWVRYRKCGLGR
jgi:hypothetical protein